MKKRKPLNASKIREAVCDQFGITPEQMVAKTKKRQITDARKMAAFLMFDNGVCKSVREVSQQIGLCRNSSYSVLVCFRELIKYDPAFRAKYEKVCTRLGLDR